MTRTRTRNTKIKTYLLLAVLLVVVSVSWLLAVMNRFHKSLPPDTRGFKTIKNAADVHTEFLSNNGTVNGMNAINSATGKVFRGERIRTYDGERRFSVSVSFADGNSNSAHNNINKDNDATTNRNRDSVGEKTIHCEKWNVVTTIFAPTEAVRRATNVKDWCTVIVADTKTPLDYMEELMKANANTDINMVTNMDTETTHNNIRNRNGDFTVFLSVEDQLAWMGQEQDQTKDASTRTSASASSAVGQFLEAIPFRHFARKNIGYLYAIAHGAQVIFDFDDDNLLPLSSSTLSSSTTVLPPLDDTKVLKHAAMVVTGPKAFNHHSLMGATVRGNSWPRGFPLTQLQNDATHGRIVLDSGKYRDLSIPREVGVLQFVADKNPDVDAIHRLVQGEENPNTGEPIHFWRHVKHRGNNENNNDNSYYDSIKKLSTMGSLVVPSHTFVPYNAQASIHTYKAMFALVLPGTVKGRVSDIWRSYFSQRIFRDVDTSGNPISENDSDNGIDNKISNGGDGLKVVILPPDIVHERNEHSLLADMQAEDDLYSKTEALLDFLNQWNPDVDADDSIPSRMEQLWIDLYERDYIQLEDVTISQLWMSALAEVGYEFPRMPPPSRRRIKDVVLMGQFNFPTIAAVNTNNRNDRNDEERVKTDLLFWYQKWRQRFDTVVLRGPFPEHLAGDFRANHEVDVRPTRQRLLSDKGFVSPMDNLLSTLKQYKNDSKINGVLYVHDDMLVNTTRIFGGSSNTKSQGTGRSSEDRTRTIYATHHLRTSFRIHPSSSSTIDEENNTSSTNLYYSTPDGFRSDNSTELLEHLEPWPFNWICMDTFSKVAKDPRSRPFLEHDDTNGGNPFLLVPGHAQSDFFYVPTSLTEEYEAIAQLLIDHDVFLECGLPRITDVLLGMPLSSPLRQQKNQSPKEPKRGAIENSVNDVRLKVVKLCTSWDYTKVRGTLQMVAECKPNTSVIHPFKLTVHGYKNWGRYFDWATAGSSKFDLGD